MSNPARNRDEGTEHDRLARRIDDLARRPGGSASGPQRSTSEPERIIAENWSGTLTPATATTYAIMGTDSAEEDVVASLNGGGSAEIRVTADPSSGTIHLIVNGNLALKASWVSGALRLGFFGADSAQPVVPATPTAQDVVDALVALGLVAQAP